MDLPKFLWMLQHSALFFSRADILEDQFEGRLPHGSERFEEATYKESYEQFERQKQAPKNLGFDEHRRWMREWVRQWTYLNCWHASNCESAAMWTIYGISGQSLAIETTVEQLASFLPPLTHLGLVKYIDFQKYQLPENNFVLPFLFKRESFSYESEVRAITLQLPQLSGHPSQIDTKQTNVISGKEVFVDLNKLICNIYVGPKTKNWYFEAVQKLADKYGLQKTVLRSPLDASALK